MTASQAVHVGHRTERLCSHMFCPDAKNTLYLYRDIYKRKPNTLFLLNA